MGGIICPACGLKIVKVPKDFRRSSPQNRYFHSVVLGVLSDHTGYTEEEMKSVLKWKFKIKKTSDLTTGEFEDFLSKVRMWASAELACFIPLPNERE